MDIISTSDAKISGQPPDDDKIIIGPEKVLSEDLDLSDLWNTFLTADRARTGTFGDKLLETFGQKFRIAFLEYLRNIVREPDDINEVGFCENCGVPQWNDLMCSVRDDGSGDMICKSCWDSWVSCDRCDDRYPADELNTTLGDQEVCDSCRDNHYTYCENCDGYYDDEDDHRHPGDYSGCCESPQLEFAVRNDGTVPLQNDTRVTITLPEGTIDAEGLVAISNYLYQKGEPYWNMAYNLDPLGDQWQTRTGNFAKRLSRLAYESHKIKLTPQILSQVGVIASDHSKQVSVQVEVTRDLNKGPEYFYNEESCWWGSYGESRCAFKTNGGFGLRTFNGRSGYISGRAWALPLKLGRYEKLIPTFDTVTPAAFVLFNGYGDLSGYAAARVLAHMTGWTYRRIQFSCEPMYVNAGGYLVAPEEIAQRYTDKHTDQGINLSVALHSSLFRTEQAEREKETADVRS